MLLWGDDLSNHQALTLTSGQDTKSLCLTGRVFPPLDPETGGSQGGRLQRTGAGRGQREGSYSVSLVALPSCRKF